MSRVRVRYAPSPTGHLHIGGARSALFNWLFARNCGGLFIVRFEDTDQERNVSDAEEKQLRALRWLGIDWDEGVDVGGSYGPYRSMERLELYQKEVLRLIEEGRAYPCYCSEEELVQEREAQLARGETPRYSGRCRLRSNAQRRELEEQGVVPSIRFRVPAGQELVVEDLVRGEVRFSTEEMGDFVIVRPGGVPVYNLAVAVDDHLMEITHVIRGEEHLSNTPRQVLIYQALGWKPPQFAHVSLILNENRQKMSKRDESIIQFVEQYADLGYLPEAVLNFLALLGWSPAGEEEVFSASELVERFSLDRVSKSPAVFDTKKLAWLNNHYIKQLPLERLLEVTLPHLKRRGWISSDPDPRQQEWLRRLVSLYQERLQCGAEIAEQTRTFFEEHVMYEEEARQVLAEAQVSQVLKGFLNLWEAAEEWPAEDVQQLLKQVQKETGLKGKALFMPIRAAATGQTHGPDLPQSLSLLGKEKVAQRIRRVVTGGV